MKRGGTDALDPQQPAVANLRGFTQPIKQILELRQNEHLNTGAINEGENLSHFSILKIYKHWEIRDFSSTISSASPV